MTDTIGIVGQGFVGSAIREGMKNDFNVQTYDKFKSDVSTCGSLQELCTTAQIVFVCLPTPMRKDGSCDLSILEDTVAQINSFKNNNIVIVKSTVVPGTTERLNEENEHVDIVFNPEFLTEANSIEDFKNQNRIIIGGPRPATTIVKNMYRKSFRDTPIVKTGSTIAEFVKYFINCFLATKVAYANEFSQMCDLQGVDYDKVVEYALYDKRIAPTHLSVPGPDGKNGFGGSCFPKDLNALIHFAKMNEVNPSVLSGVWDKNIDVRPERDWELLKGRAVSEEQGE